MARKKVIKSFTLSEESVQYLEELTQKHNLKSISETLDIVLKILSKHLRDTLDYYIQNYKL